LGNVVTTDGTGAFSALVVILKNDFRIGWHSLKTLSIIAKYIILA